MHNAHGPAISGGSPPSLLTSARTAAAPRRAPPRRRADTARPARPIPRPRPRAELSAPHARPARSARRRRWRRRRRRFTARARRRRRPSPPRRAWRRAPPRARLATVTTSRRAVSDGAAASRAAPRRGTTASTPRGPFCPGRAERGHRAAAEHEALSRPRVGQRAAIRAPDEGHHSRAGAAGGRSSDATAVKVERERELEVASGRLEQRGRLGRVLSSDRRELHRCCRRDHRLDDQRVVRPGSQTSPSFWIRIFSTQGCPRTTTNAAGGDGGLLHGVRRC